MEQREVLLYVRRCSLRCWRARRLLTRRGYMRRGRRHDQGAPRATLKQLSRGAYRETVSYIFVDHRPVGASATSRPSTVRAT